MNARKTVLTNLSVLIILIITWYSYLVYKNNLHTDEPSSDETHLALDKSIDWVLKNQEKLININNPVLWWFLDESVKLNNNKELASLVNNYKDTILDKTSVWSGYWQKTWFTYITGSLDFMEDYQKLFIYGLSCNKDLADEKTIKEQLNINYCDWRPYYSSCTTHQLMGIRLLQINNCGEQNIYGKLTDELANTIKNQLIWDPRVGDVYIQRVLMLTESGNRKLIKPIWVKNIIDEQLDDGSWASFDKLFPVYHDTYFGFSYKSIDIRKPVSSFHATAQAIYLLSLIIADR